MVNPSPPIYQVTNFYIFVNYKQKNNISMKTNGLDVHKYSIFCAIYSGKEYSEVKEYDKTTPNIRLMGEYLRSEVVEKVAMESASTYWVLVWDVLVEIGFKLTLVNHKKSKILLIESILKVRQYQKNIPFRTQSKSPL